MPSENKIELECRILCALASYPSGDEFCACIAALTAYPWREAEHRVVYDALRRIGFLPPPARQRELTAEVTRMGFPDVDSGAYFGGDSGSAGALPELIRQVQAQE